jgi:decaprenylphospho-beta-D-ribofuranose 2-oxidase
MTTRGFALAETPLASFDRQFRASARVQRPDRYRLLEALPAGAPRIARGSGVSYVAASFGAGAISQQMTAFDRLLAFDADSGVLEIEAGARVGDVQRFALGRGWYLPVTPGHPASTIGGCIAADVHGKNPARDGTFREHVVAIDLVRAGAGACRVDRGHQAGLFAATCGGYGLTGTIASAALQLARPPSGLVVRRMPVNHLAEAARVLREAANTPVLYGWHDGRASHFGRGVIRIGLASEALADSRAPRHADLPATIDPAPFTLWNRAGIAAANTWLGARWCRPGDAPLPLSEALFPLNAARGYFAGFGKAGLVEAQWLIPHARFDAFAGTLAERVARDRPRIALISSKLFAGESEGLAFDGRGIALAFHLPAPQESSQRAFLESLAELALEHGGRPNPVKDSTLDATLLRGAIADFDAARARLAEHNPGGLHTSELACRLGL